MLTTTSRAGFARKTGVKAKKQLHGSTGIRKRNVGDKKTDEDNKEVRWLVNARVRVNPNPS